MEGYGHYEYLDGGFYEGQYLKNKYHGQGVSRYPNHSKLSKDKSDTKKVDKKVDKSSTADDKKSVASSTTISNERNKVTASKLDAKAEDESDDDDDHEGEDLVKGGSSYEGQYQSGRFHGQGFMKCRNASEYRGAFREGRRFVRCLACQTLLYLLVK